MSANISALAKTAAKLNRSDNPPDEDIRDLYDQLDSAKAKLTPEVIKSSGIGKQLNLLRKKCSSQALAKRGKQFVLGLKDVVSPRPQRARKPPTRLSDEWQPSEEQVGQKGACPFVAATVYEEDEARPLPKRNKHGELVFADAPDFRPNLTPQQVIEAGAFGGGYFRDITSRVTGRRYKDAWKEFPKEWFANVNISQSVACARYNERRNKYKVKCGADKDFWEQKGWMSDIDPYGWFQWWVPDT